MAYQVKYRLDIKIMQKREFVEEMKLLFEVLNLDFEWDIVAVEAINETGVGKGKSGCEDTTAARQSRRK